MELVFALFLSFVSPAWAEDLPENPETLEDITEKPLPKKSSSTEPQEESVLDEVEKVLDETQTRRRKISYFGLVNYSPLDLVIPNKFGLSAGLARTSEVSWEFEYVSGSFGVPFFLESIGEMRDERYSFIIRNYWGNSLNFSYGLTYFKFGGNVGSDLISRLPGSRPSDVDILNIQSWGINVGIGNRWIITDRIALGIDWINWSQPVSLLRRDTLFTDYVSDPTDKERVEKVVKYMSFFPRFTVLKIQVGLTF